MPLIVQGDNLEILPTLEAATYALVYVDPPFNTGRRRDARRIRVRAAEGGARRGFGDRRYQTTASSRHRGFSDDFPDFRAFLEPRLRQAKRLLTPQGSLFVHLDPREVHYVKVLLDEVFGRASFMNEIIWAYDYGGRPKNRWPAKHDNILWYAADPRRYTYDYDAIDRIPYLAPGLVGAEKAARGKVPTDVWWNTIVPTHGTERTGYPTQKPLAILERIVRVHSAPGDHVLDFFAGSGTTGEAAARNGRDFTMIDCDPRAVRLMQRRLAFASPELRIASTRRTQAPHQRSS